MRAGLGWRCPGHKLRTRSLTLPIEATTAHAMKGDREISIEAWMNGYISKPISSQPKRLPLRSRERDPATTHATPGSYLRQCREVLT
jgi:CheY-like chemotaxis protein